MAKVPRIVVPTFTRNDTEWTKRVAKRDQEEKEAWIAEVRKLEERSKILVVEVRELVEGCRFDCKAIQAGLTKERESFGKKEPKETAFKPLEFVRLS